MRLEKRAVIIAIDAMFCLLYSKIILTRLFYLGDAANENRPGLV